LRLARRPRLLALFPLFARPSSSVFDDPSTLVFSVVLVPVDGISVAPKCVHFFFVLVVVVVVVVVGL